MVEAAHYEQELHSSSKLLSFSLGSTRIVLCNGAVPRQRKLNSRQRASTFNVAVFGPPAPVGISLPTVLVNIPVSKKGLFTVSSDYAVGCSYSITAHYIMY